MKKLIAFLLIICLCGCTSNKNTTNIQNTADSNIDAESSNVGSTYSEIFGEEHDEKRKNGLQEAQTIETPEGQYLENCPIDAYSVFSEDGSKHLGMKCLFFVDKERFKGVSYNEYSNFIDSKKSIEDISDLAFSTIIFGDGTGIKFDNQEAGYGTYGVLSSNDDVKTIIIRVFSENDYNNLLKLIEQNPEEAVKQQLSKEQERNNVVYVGVSGNKYHNKNCSTLKGNGRETSYEEAIRKGYTACKVCH